MFSAFSSIAAIYIHLSEAGRGEIESLPFSITISLFQRSMSSQASLSLASTVVGFISFAFTFLTLLRVTWTNLQALGEAPSEIKYAFANLRSALHEEREHLRHTARYQRRQRSHSGRRNSNSNRESKRSSADPMEQAKAYLGSDEITAQWRVLNDTVKRLCAQFHEIERPFLRDATSQPGSGDGDEEKWRDWREEERKYGGEQYINDYSDMTLNHRILWLWKKSEVMGIRDSLTNLKIRRISQEVTATWL